MTNESDGWAMKPRNDRGFSLVEVLVAAAVIALSLFAVVAVVRKGQDMIAIEKHRGMARGIIEQTLEKPPYQPEYYNSLTTISSPTATNVIIDPGMNPNLQGSLTVAVGAEVTTVNSVTAPYRAVTATVTWTESGSPSQTVTITKWLADVQRN
jgi:prepilin-type N-terminal cleavage/methylation domain-containing protein